MPVVDFLVFYRSDKPELIPALTDTTREWVDLEPEVNGGRGTLIEIGNDEEVVFFVVEAVR